MGRLTSELFVRLIDGVTRPAMGISRAFNGIGQSANQLNRSTQFGMGLANAAARANTGLDAMRGRMFDAVAAGYALTRALQSPVVAAMDFESAMADVNKVVDFGGAEGIERFKKELIELSKVVPVSVQGLAQIAAAAGQAGFAADEIIKVTEAAAKLGVAFDITAEQAGDAIPKLQNSMGLTLEEVLKLTDAMNHLSNSQASAAGDILEVTTKVGAYALQAGFTAEQTSALASAMLSTGQEVDVVATSIRNLGLMLGRGTAATKAQRDGFKALALDAADVSENMQIDAIGTLADILERISQLPANKRGAVSSQIFGNESRALGPLISNLELLPSALSLIADEAAYAGSATKEFEVRAKTFANTVEIWDNRLYALKVTIGNALIPAISDLIAKMTPVVEGIGRWAEAHPELTRNIISAAAALVTFRIATTALKWAGLYSMAGALGGLSKAFLGVGKAAAIAQTAIALQTALAAGGNYTWIQKVGTGLMGIVRAVPGLNLVGPALSALAAGVGAIGFAGVAIIGGIAAGGVLIWKYWDRLTSIFSGVGRAISDLIPDLQLPAPFIKEFADAGRGIGETWDWSLGKLQEFGNWVSSFFGQEVLTEAEKAAFAQAGYDWAMGGVNGVKDAFFGLVEWFKNLPQMIMDGIGSIDIASLFRWPEPPGWLTWLINGGNGAPTTNANGSTRTAPGPKPYAMGGHIRKGETGIVGDGGEPEFFTAGATGYITPFSKVEPIEGGLGGGRGSVAASSGTTTISPTLVIKGNVYGVDDLEARFEQFASRMKAEYDSSMAGSFADVETT